MTDLADADIRAAIHRLLGQRATDATICPSDVARDLAPEPGWRDLMDDVRRVAAEDHARGHLEIRQHGERVDDPGAVRGPIRLGRPRH